MGLSCRRLLSSVINGIIIFIILIIISFFIATTLWFVPLGSILDMKWFYVLFAMMYSLLGGVGSYFLPRLGSRITRIQIREIKDNDRRKIKIFLRLLLFYLVPTVLLYIYSYPFIEIASGDIKLMIMMIAPLFFFSIFAILIIPTSIVIGKGHQGIHDAMTGLVICGSSGNIYDLMPVKKLIIRSVSVTFIISFFLLLVFFSIIAVFKLQNAIFDIVYKTTPQGINTPIVKEFDSLVPITPIQYRSYDFNDGFRWWVDLTQDANQKIRVNRAIGLKPSNDVDLLGYGFNIKTLSAPVVLLNTDRVKKHTLNTGSKILSVLLFMDSAAFYFPEVNVTIHKYFKERVIPYAISKKFDAIKIKSIRMIRVGYIEIGESDEVYIVNNKLWRNEDDAYFPMFLTVDRNILPMKCLIVSENVK